VALMSVTPIGATEAGLDKLVDDYIAYLAVYGSVDRAAIRPADDDGIVRYYADSVECPGMWSGHGARRLGLVGQVDAESSTTANAATHRSGCSPRSNMRTFTTTNPSHDQNQTTRPRGTRDTSRDSAEPALHIQVGESRIVEFR
jgi:hypothetical protein